MHRIVVEARGSYHVEEFWTVNITITQVVSSDRPATDIGKCCNVESFEI